MFHFYFPFSPGSHYNGPLSRVDGEAVGDWPLILTFLNLQTQEKSRNYQPDIRSTHLFTMNYLSLGIKGGNRVRKSDSGHRQRASTGASICVCVEVNHDELITSFSFSLLSVTEFKQNTPDHHITISCLYFISWDVHGLFWLVIQP